MKRWLVLAVRAAIFAGAFYGWRVAHVEGFGNVLAFYAWLAFIVAALLAAAGTKGDPLPPVPRPLGWARGLFDAGAVLAFAWIGSFGYAVLWILAALLMAVARRAAHGQAADGHA